MPILRISSNKNNYISYILSVFIFLFSTFLFFQPVSLDSSIFEPNNRRINIAEAQCTPELPPDSTGGFVPCGRIIDDMATTGINENAPCNLCAMFYMLKNIINFVMTLAIGIGVFILVIAGLLYAFSAGDSRKIDVAKSAVTSAIIGIAIVFLAWLVIAVILQGMGYANMATWNQVNCNMAPGGPPTVLPYCGDGIVNNGEVCDWSIPVPRNCMATPVGAPAYCVGTLVNGTQACNCTCDGWDACIALSAPVSSSSTACASTSPQMNDYACCELLSCGLDGCGCCGRAWGAATPGGFNTVDTSASCSGSCKMNRSITNPRDWMVTTEHTTATYRCWQ